MRALLIMAAAAGAIACGAPPLQTTHRSAEALGRAVLDAVAHRDEASLRALALTEMEFRRVVWPSLPAARPERNVPFSYVWRELRQKSDDFLRAMLAAHGGRRYELVRVTFAGRMTDYAGFRVYREAVLVVRDHAGLEREVRFCGSMLERDGQWKVFSYVTDD